MMYQSKMVVAIKSAGKILRESGDTCYLPFGCEYSLLIKNLNIVRAKVKISIDGEDVTDGVSLVVNANSSIDLERFICNGNTEQGNRFKFIERTAAVEEHRGVQAEDGLVRVEFEFERQPEYHYLSGNYEAYRHTKGITRNGLVGRALDWTARYGDVVCSTSAECSSNPGITVPGSVSDQKFTTVSPLITDGKKHVMVLRLLGEVQGVAVEKPVTVKHKPKCTTCGKQNKATAKFCAECGTSLTIV